MAGLTTCGATGFALARFSDEVLEAIMTRTVTGDFGSEDAMKNAMDDLISNGIPREEVFMDSEHMQLKVMVPDAIEASVGEILRRHHASKLH